MNSLEDISAAVGLFHDGTIVRASLDDEGCEWCVDLEYLAERIQPEFELFTLRFEQFSDCRFEPYCDEQTPIPPIAEFTKIAALDLGILSSEVLGNDIRVACTQDYHDVGFTGGTLIFRATGVRIFDQGGRELNLDALNRLSEGYWEEWERNSKRTP